MLPLQRHQLDTERQRGWKTARCPHVRARGQLVTVLLSPWRGAHDPRSALLHAVPCVPVFGMRPRVGAPPAPMSPVRATVALAQPSPRCVVCQGGSSYVRRPASPHRHQPTRKPRVTPVRPAGTVPLGGWLPQWHSSHSCCKWHRPTVTSGYSSNCQRNQKFFQEKFLGARTICFARPWAFPRGSAVALTPTPNLSVILRLQENEASVAPRPINGFWGVTEHTQTTATYFCTYIVRTYVRLSWSWRCIVKSVGLFLLAH